MGGNVPLGYRVEARKLVVVEPEAELVRRIFARFAALGSALKVARELNAAGEVTKRWNANSKLQGGRAWTKGDIYKILANRVYLGQAVHKGVAYPGEHAAIVDQELWDRAHGVMAEPTRQRAATSRAQVPMLLKGLIFGPNGRAMSPSHTKRRGRVHRYYVTREAIAEGYDSCTVKSVPAADVEAAVLAQVQRLLTTPEMIARTWTATKGELDEREVLGRLADFGSLWAELFPAEQARIMKLLVERVDVQADGLEVRLRAEGLASLVAELRQQPADGEGGLSHARREPARGRHPGGADPDAARAAARPQAHPGAGRQRADAAHQAAAGRRAGQGAGPGVAVAEAAGPGRLQLGDRDRRGGEDQQELRQPDPAAGAAGAGHRRGDPRRVGGSAGDAGAAGAAAAGGVGGAAAAPETNGAVGW